MVYLYSITRSEVLVLVMTDSLTTQAMIELQISYNDFYDFSPARSSVRHTGGSVKNG